ncbi:hypothetical protein BDV98DRAFT_590051 [Pterulicium gracile]|uniref:Uncharacterized protein n=1 Tax=Pterulicium gracile TaxID=1884261 RepID=A0A5C3QVF3_9AGAR|nr:hypothetical protein BDV98DRAFT_590051 [Pterula gracilis]
MLTFPSDVYHRLAFFSLLNTTPRISSAFKRYGADLSLKTQESILTLIQPNPPTKPTNTMFSTIFTTKPTTSTWESQPLPAGWSTRKMGTATIFIHPATVTITDLDPRKPQGKRRKRIDNVLMSAEAKEERRLGLTIPKQLR